MCHYLHKSIVLQGGGRPVVDLPPGDIQGGKAVHAGAVCDMYLHKKAELAPQDPTISVGSYQWWS